MPDFAATFPIPHKEAVAAYQEALRISPTRDDAYSNLARALVALKLNDEAIAAYRKANAIRPDSISSYLDLAEALASIQRNDQAIAVLNDGIQTFPESAEAHYQLGLLYSHQNRQAEAVREWDTVLRIEPTHKNALAELARAKAKSKLPRVVGPVT